MMLTRRLVSGSLLALALSPAANIGCGGGVLDAGGADASAYSSDGATPHADAHDAAADAVATRPDDGGTAASRDATAPSDPMAPCAGDRDVFAYDVLGYPGPFQLGAQRFTNHDAAWRTDLSPEITVRASSGTGAGGGIDIYMPGGGVPSPGVYPQGSSRHAGDAGAAPSLSVVIGSEGCALTSGTLTIVELTTLPATDAGDPRMRSLLASFDVMCAWDTSSIPVRGCMRFAVSP